MDRSMLNQLVIVVHRDIVVFVTRKDGPKRAEELAQLIPAFRDDRIVS